MNTLPGPQLAHMGILVRDIDAMTRFYTEVFGLRLTDQGVGRTFRTKIHFMSSSPEQHHQMVLAAGRSPEGPSTVMQISFKVQSLAQLRTVRDRALREGATQMRGLNHGNALSIYFADIEENTIEVYLDTPWYVPQPHGDPLDLDKSDAEIWAETEAICRADPAFEPVEDWAKRFMGTGA
ncbi:MAG: VOC family protein [Burkholderiales bacterium]|nr:VOC family protein [Burkholderiales bacterium]